MLVGQGALAAVDGMCTLVLKYNACTLLTPCTPSRNPLVGSAWVLCLYRVCEGQLVPFHGLPWAIQGYLTAKKTHPPRTLQYAHA